MAVFIGALDKVYATVHVYMSLFSKVPKKHGHVQLVTLYVYE